MSINTSGSKGLQNAAAAPSSRAIFCPAPGSIADKITVLQRGQILAEGPYEDVSKNPQVMEAYMGTADAALEGH